jgi:hypothetical protein
MLSVGILRPTRPVELRSKWPICCGDAVVQVRLEHLEARHRGSPLLLGERNQRRRRAERLWCQQWVLAEGRGGRRLRCRGTVPVRDGGSRILAASANAGGIGYRSSTQPAAISSGGLVYSRR